MKTFNKKKGFTIVELVIVIAVIGVLTAVLVPTFVNLVNKANEASNQAFVKDLNTAMAMREVEEGKNKTMSEAVKDAQDIGFDVEKLTPVNGRDLVWDSVANRFLLLESNGDVWFGKDEKKATKDIEIWKLYDSMPQVQKYSIYAKPTWTADAITGLNVGFDAGSNTAIQTVNYTNLDAAKSVIIRTNGGTLTVNAPEDTINHYGEANVVNLQAVGSHSFYERGSVNLVDIKKGRLIITNDEETEIGTIYLSATDDTYDGIILATQNGSELPGIVAREGVSAPDSGEKLVVTIQTNVNEEGENPAEEESIYLYPESDVKEGDNGYDVSDLGLLVVEAVSSEGQAQAEEQLADKGEEVLEEIKESHVADAEEVTTAATLFAGGNGSERKPYVITSREEFLNINEMYDKGYKFFTVDAKSKEWNFDANGKPHMDGAEWPTVDDRTVTNLNGSLEGNGLTIDNLDAWLFNFVGNENLEEEQLIKNLTINADINISATGVSAVYRSTGAINVTLNGITVHGNLTGGDSISSFVGYGSGQTWYNSSWQATKGFNLKFENCYSDATIVGTEQTGGFIGNWYSKATESSLTIIDSKYEGFITYGSRAQYLAANYGGYDTVPVTYSYSEGYNTDNIPVTEGELKLSTSYALATKATKLGDIVKNANNTYSVAKAAGAATAKAYIYYSYAPGGITGMVLVEDNLTLADDKFTTSYTYQYYTLNGTTTADTFSIDIEGAQSLNLLTLYVVQFNSNGQSLGYSTYSIPSEFIK